MKRQVTDALRLQFRPEFLNRIDEVIVFHALTEADLAAIVELLLADLQRGSPTQDLALELTPAARALIAREGTDPAFGARPLKRTIQRLVENPLARALLAGRSSPGDDRRRRGPGVGDARVLQRRSRHGRGRGARPARRPRPRDDAASRRRRRGRRGSVARRSTCRADEPDAAATAASSSTSRRSPMRFDDVVRAARARCRRPAGAAGGADPGRAPRPAQPRRGPPWDEAAPPGGRRPCSSSSPRTRPARRGSCSPSAPTAAGTTRARSRFRAARAEPERRRPRRDRAARGRTRRSASTPTARACACSARCPCTGSRCQQLPGDAGRRARGRVGRR